MEREEIIKALEKIEFNNEEEDKDMLKDEKRKENAPKRKIMIYLGCSLFLIGLVCTIIFGGISIKEEHENKEKGIPSKSETEQIDNYRSTNSRLYLNKYIYDNETHKLIDLSSKKSIKLEDNPKYIFSYKDRLYFTYTDKNNFVNAIKILKDNKVVSLFSDKDLGFISDKNNIIGFYKDNGKKLYFFAGDNYEEKSLENVKLGGFYSDFIGGIKQSFINEYDNNYLITSNIISNNEKIGLYDLNNNKEVLSTKYNGLYYLEAKKYLAIKDSSVGIIDINDNVLSSFQYVQNLNKNKTVSLIDYKEGTVLFRVYDNYTSYVYTLKEDKLTPLGEMSSSITYHKLKDNFILSNSDNNTNTSKKSIIIYNYKTSEMKNLSPQTSNVIGTFLNDILVIKENGKYSFINTTTGADLGNLNKFSKDYSEYLLTFKLEHDGIGTIIISKDDNELGKLENASFDRFIMNSDDRLRITDERIIYHATENDGLDGDILIIKK